MDFTIERILDFASCLELGVWECVSKHVNNIIKTKYLWRALCFHYFKLRPSITKKLEKPQCSKQGYWHNIRFTLPNPMEHKGEWHDYLEYYCAAEIDPWKRLFLLFNYAFNNKKLNEETEKSVLEKFSKMQFFDENGVENKGEDYEKGVIYTNDVISALSNQCQSAELESIFENFIIYTYITQESLMPYWQLPISGELAKMKKRKGYKITKDSKDATALLFKRVMKEEKTRMAGNVAEYTKDLMEESYAIRKYTKILNTVPKKYDVAKKMLTYYGAPSMVVKVITDHYHPGDYDLILLEEEREFWQDYSPDNSADELEQKLGVLKIAAILCGETAPEDVSPKMETIAKLQEIIFNPGSELSVKIWALAMIVKNKEFSEFWQSTDETRKAVTNILIRALTDKEQDWNWNVRRITQRILVHEINKQQIDVEMIKESLEAVVAATDIAALPLNEVGLGVDGDILCWVLFVLLRTKLGDFEKYSQLGQKLFIETPNLDPKMREEIIQYFGPFLRDGCHPRWYIEATLKGVEFKDSDMPFYTLYSCEKKDDPHSIASKQLQQKIIDTIGNQFTHAGFETCASKIVSPCNGIGTYYKMLISLDYNKYICLSLSEVGPYAQITQELEETARWIPEQVRKQDPNSLPESDIMAIILDALAKSGVKVLTKEELDFNLSNFQFCTHLGSVGNHYRMRHTISTLLFLFTD